MSHRRHGNDNIRTSHLKCDRCRTRIELTSIEQFEGFETRSFACRHCAAVKLVRVSSPEASSQWQGKVCDHSSC